MIPVYAVVDGLPRVFAGITRENNREAIRLRAGMLAAMQHLLAATRPYVPVDEGDLLASGKVTENENKYGGNIYAGMEFDVEFGGTAPSGRSVDYAVTVHEDLTFYHAPPTQAKFLTRAIAENRAAMAALIRMNFGTRQGVK